LGCCAKDIFEISPISNRRIMPVFIKRDFVLLLNMNLSK
jgi:hypothetical protein